MRSSCCLVCALLLALVLARNAQSVDFSFNSNFTRPELLLLDGNCTVAGSDLLMLSVNSSDRNLGSARNLRSRAVYAEPVQLYDAATGAAASFNTSFVFGMKAVPGNYMGDGMAFLIAPTRFVPHNSDGTVLGLYDPNAYKDGDPQIHVVAVEWDTVQDSGLELDSNHVGLDINSVVSVKAQELSEFGFQLNASQNLQRFQVWIEYDAGLAQIVVYMADWRPEALVSRSDAALVLSYTGFNLSRYVQSSSYVGFTATTGFYIQENYIYDWSFSSRGLPPSAAPAPAPLPPPEADPPPAAKSGSSKVGLVAGIVSGVVAFLVVAGVVACCCCLFCRRRADEGSSVEPAKLLATRAGWNGPGGGNPISSAGGSSSGASSQNKGSSTSPASGSSWSDLDSPNVAYGPRPYSYQELMDAARGFSNAEMLGHGGFGHVYRGVIRNADGSEMTVAIKKIAQNSNQGEREFRAEVLSIGRLRHKNLVHLLVWCHEDGKLLLVHEFMTNSSLDRHLYSAQGHLPWEQRFRIVQGVAAALVYIHTEAPEKCILHQDLKPSNVMLDSRMRARLGDFGLAQIVEDTTMTDGTGAGVSLTHLAGTRGYIAPEFAMAGKATTKSDIFSFGVLALELASGKKPYPPIHEDEPDVRLLDWVWQMHEAVKLLEVADPALEGRLDQSQLQRVLHVGLLCTLPDPRFRPHTKRMQQMLQEDVAMPPLPLSRPVAIYNSLGSWGP